MRGRLGRACHGVATIVMVASCAYSLMARHGVANEGMADESMADEKGESEATSYDFSDDDLSIYGIVIEDESSLDMESMMSFQWLEDVARRHFGTLGGHYHLGEGYYRRNASLYTGFDVPFAKGGRLYVAGYVRDSSIGFTQEVLPTLASTIELIDPDILQRSLRFSAFDQGVADAFIEYAVTDDIVITIGRKRVLWGQFDLFSPLNILLPLNSERPSSDVEKINVVLPQDQVALTYYVDEHMHVEAYYFYRTQIDPILTRAIGASQDLIYELHDENFSVLDLHPSKHRDIERHNNYALRLLYYGEGGIWGLTYREGHRAYYGVQGRIEVVPPIREGEVTYNVLRDIDLPKVRQWALEAAIPFGAWIVKMESVYQKSAIDLYGASYASRDDILPFLWGEALPTLRDYLTEVVEDNGGRLFFDVERVSLAMGVDARLSSFDINLMVSMTYTHYDDKENRLRRLSNRLSIKGLNRFDIVPGVHVSYRFGDEDKYRVGVGWGHIGHAFGIFSYTRWRFRDNIELSLSFESLQYATDSLLSKIHDGTPFRQGIYIERQARNYGGHMGLTYHF